MCEWKATVEKSTFFPNSEQVADTFRSAALELLFDHLVCVARMIRMLACPSRSLTAFGWTPALSKALAQLCLLILRLNVFGSAYHDR